jgi:site-specific DNA-methyltransferase (adenine-specific)
LEWSEEWLKELVRITREDGCIFVHNVPKWLTYYTQILNKYAIFKHWISWRAPTAPMGKTLQPAHYGILFYTKDIKNFKFYEIRSPHKRTRDTGVLEKDYGGKKSLLHPFGALLSDVWTDIHRIKHKINRDDHPCQLPVHLLERIVLMSTDENDIVLDPFMGTGTTAIAAKKLNRKYMGIEIDEKYCEIANNKLKSENSISKIGNIYISGLSDKIITVRDKDWKELSNYFDIPKDMREIEKRQIKLKTEKLPTITR